MPSEPWPAVDYGLRLGLRGLDGPLSLDAVSAAAGYSRFHFSRLVRRVSGRSLADYVARLRILRAKRLLARTADRVSDIAPACGYASLGTFSRRFRALAGFSPTGYRAWVRGAAPQATTRAARTVAGTVTCVPPLVGHVHIGLFADPACVGRPLGETRLDAPGPFELPAPAGPCTAYAVACCCHPSYPGDLSLVWAAAGPTPADTARLTLDLRPLHPAAAPVVATFGNGGEDRPCPAALSCGLGPMTPREVGPMMRGIASVLVYVRDMDASIDFYSRLLDAPVSHRDDTIALFTSGGTRFILHRDKLPARGGVRGAMEVDLEVEDVGAFHARMAQCGVEATEPHRYPWGWRGCAVTDPDGNVIEVYEIASDSVF